MPQLPRSTVLRVFNKLGLDDAGPKSEGMPFLTMSAIAFLISASLGPFFFAIGSSSSESESAWQPAANQHRGRE
jgi:hypothetical protein